MDDKKRDHLSDLINEYAPLIRLHAKNLERNLPPGMEVEDLHSHGVHGLIDALHKYDPKQGSFKNYVGNRIKGLMRDGIKDYIQGDSNSISNHFSNEANKWTKKQMSADAPSPELPEAPTKEEE